MSKHSGFTRVEGVPDSSDAVPGMAYFAGTGPAGKTCGGCMFHGYYRKGERHGETVTFRYNGCLKFKELAGGKHGPAIGAGNKACKYFEERQP